MSRQQTNKTVKVVGTRQYIDAETGELQTMAVTTVEDRDFNFHKFWMKNFIQTLDIVGNKKTKLCFGLLTIWIGKTSYAKHTGRLQSNRAYRSTRLGSRCNCCWKVTLSEGSIKGAISLIRTFRSKEPEKDA